MVRGGGLSHENMARFSVHVRGVNRLKGEVGARLRSDLSRLTTTSGTSNAPGEGGALALSLLAKDAERNHHVFCVGAWRSQENPTSN